MLKELILSDLILTQQAHVCFEPYFTVISGETGSGKSAILEGIHLILGARTDSALIRHGSEKGVVEGVFDCSSLPRSLHYLTEKGIDIDDPERIVIKREITTAGKTKAYINHQPVSLSLLKGLKEHVLEMVSQAAGHQLFDLDSHRHFLDLFGALLPLKSKYEAAYHTAKTLQKELAALKESVAKSASQIERCASEIAEIEEAHLKEGEEEELFAAYSSLASAKERLHAAEDLSTLLGGERGVLALLNRGRQSHALLLEKDATLSEPLSLFPQVILEVEELLHTARKYAGNIETNPHKQETLNERLTALTRLKKKYGATLEEIFAHLDQQKKRLHVLQNLDHEIEALELKVKEATKHLETLAKELSSQRTRQAASFAKAIESELFQLNMPYAQFHVQITPTPLSPSGAENVEFFLHSNMGERQIPLRDGASGGELARVFLAIHLLLAGSEGVGTLIFDEIDANIGGKAASIIGEKLKKLGKSLQVLCITHFPQVAAFADHHLHIEKSVLGGRTFSQIAPLSPAEREKELLRMSGK